MRAAPCIAAIAASAMLAAPVLARSDERAEALEDGALAFQGLGAEPWEWKSAASAFPGDDPEVSLYGLQARSTLGDMRFEGGYLHTLVAPWSGTQRLAGTGWQLRASWLLNPERPGEAGASRPIGGRPAWGLWELEAGYRTLDAESDALAALARRKLSLGLNWYISPGLRMKASYSRMKNQLADHDLPGEPARPRVLQLRMQAEF